MFNQYFEFCGDTTQRLPALFKKNMLNTFDELSYLTTFVSSFIEVITFADQTYLTRFLSLL